MPRWLFLCLSVPLLVGPAPADDSDPEPAPSVKAELRRCAGT